VYSAAAVGAFDDIPNLVHVYCPARRWLTSYNDFASEIMNADTDALDQFGYTAEGNTDTVAIISWLSGSNGLIRTLPDQKTGDHVTQTTKANMPLFVASGQGGHAVGRYNGTSHHLRGAYTSGGALSQPFSVYAVAQLAGVDTGAGRYIVDGFNSARMIVGQLAATPDKWWIYAGTILQSAIASNSNWNIWSVLFNGASGQFWHNGTSLAAGGVGADNATGITIGTDSSEGGGRWLGDIATIAIAENHDTTARQAVEAVLGSYWSVP
jgi:hypothetical protein